MLHALFALLLSTTAAATEFEMAHSGRLTDASGSGINDDHDISVRLFDGPGLTAALLWEDDFRVPFTDGYFSVMLGSDPAMPLTTANVDAPSVWLELELDSSGAPMNRTPLTVSPVSAQTLGVRTGAVSGASCDSAGELNYASGALLACDGATWRPTGPTRLTEASGLRTWADGDLAKNCSDYLDSEDPNRWYIGPTGDGTYRIDLDGDGPLAPQDVECDMTNGGWIDLQEVLDPDSLVLDNSPNVNFYASGRQLQVQTGACNAEASLPDTLYGAFEIRFRAKYGWGWAGVALDRLDAWGGDNTHDGCSTTGFGCWRVMNNRSNNLLHVSVMTDGEGSPNLNAPHPGVSESTDIEIRRDSNGVITAWAGGGLKHTYAETYTGPMRAFAHTQCDNGYNENTWVRIEDVRMKGE